MQQPSHARPSLSALLVPWAMLAAAPAQAGGVAAAPAQAGGVAAAALDVTPPVLTAFDAGATLNLAKPTPPFSVLVKASDDLSGVRSVLFWASGPSGQRIPALVELAYPVKSHDGRIGFGALFAGRLLQPGVWTIAEARVEDVAGNHAEYDHAALAALGNATFTVVNKGSHDAAAPSVDSGQVLTPVVSLSSAAKGTAALAPFVGIKVVASDTGSTALAGLAGAEAAFCIAGDNPCIELRATPLGGAQPSATLTLGAQVATSLGHVPGEYELCELGVWDQAGNASVLSSVACGGSTDFSLYFPTTRITLTP
ncbi:MAG: hypothetical protein U1F53_03510 [Burkholderiaceae bacterium]